MLLNSFQSFFVAAGKPQLGLGATVAAGVTNMVLDFVFIVLFQWGIAGAAIATAISQIVGGVIPLFYFSSKNSSSLHLGNTKNVLEDFVENLCEWLIRAYDKSFYVNSEYAL